MLRATGCSARRSQVPSATASSNDLPPSKAEREVNQLRRIEQCARSGEPTNSEVATLEHGQARVVRKEARALADGHIGPHAIQHVANVQSKRIYNKKHNARTRS